MPPREDTRPHSDLDPASLGPRLLAVVPHPDDEALAIGGTLAAAAAVGIEVRVAFLTDGDGYVRGAAAQRGRTIPILELPRAALVPADFQRLGEVRVAEAVASLRALGLEPGDGIFLGLPDGRLSAMRATPDAPVAGASGHTDTRDGSWAPGSPYTGESVSRSLQDLVAWLDPTCVLLPHPADGNADHRAAAWFANAALDETGCAATRLSYLVHAGTWPHMTSVARGLRPPGRFIRSGRWSRTLLGPEARSAKTAAIEAHASQTAIRDLAWFMRSFDRADEWLEAAGGPGTDR